MNLDSKTPVPALNRLDSPPVPIDDEQRKLILLFGSFVKQARREDRYDDFLHHTFSRWWSKWPVDYPPTPGVIERSKLVCPMWWAFDGFRADRLSEHHKAPRMGHERHRSD